MTAVGSAARRARTCFVCTACGADTPKWQGRCDACGAWNTLVEQLVPGARTPVRGVGRAEVIPLPVVASGGATRMPIGIGEVDRVLGGGIVPGSLVLLGGDPGIGKSTLALEVARRCGSEGRQALYAAGEESAGQVAMRAARIGCSGSEVAVLAETDLELVIDAIETHRPALAVVDSVQTLHGVEAPGAPGSVNQVREAAIRLLRCAKSTATAVLLVGHVTKDGALAGPRTLEHMVDVVLYLEGERHGDHRLLRGVKNRFGATDDIGVLVLDEAGIREAPAPGRAFLEASPPGVSGTAVTVACEGSRPIAVEVQALVVQSQMVMPRRAASGLDLGRVGLLLAVLDKRGGIRMSKDDVYVNAVGGFRIAEPAVDLSVVLALASAKTGRVLPAGLAAIGEVGLAGEVRQVRRLDRRLAEAAALGLERAVIPAQGEVRVPRHLNVLRVRSVREALDRLGIGRTASAGC